MDHDEVTSGKRYNPLPYPRGLTSANDIPSAAAEWDIAVTDNRPVKQPNMQPWRDRDSWPKRVEAQAITHRQKED